MAKSNLRKNLKLKPSELAKKRKQERVTLMVLYVVFFILLIIGASFLSKTSFLTINKVEISGLGFLKEKQIFEIVSRNTEGSILWLFPKNNIFLYPKSKIKSEILTKYKRVSQAEISLKDFSYLDISISEREPFGFWCKATAENYKNCFFVDKDGFVFDKISNSDFKRFPNFTRYFGGLNIKNEIGGSFLGEVKFKELQKLINLISSTFDSNIKTVYKQDSMLEIALGSGTVLKVLSDDDFENIFENLVTLLSDPEFQKTNNPIALFEYIDLRFGQKVFYKLR